MLRNTLQIGLLASALFVASPGFAQTVQVLGDYRDWSAYSANDGSGPVCFAASKPKTTEPEPDGYAQAYVYITNRAGQGTRHEFNLIAGYQFAPDSTATATVGSNSFDLYTQADGAWLMDIGQAENFAGSIRAGSSLVIEGSTDAGIRVVQTFSLSGATAAQHAIDGAC
ncbi:MAG: hypothetical protein H6873_00760 [Hyphomicrobiaceae bacterium]|nr:hypothetical protein [Hyphomicrobiaceae bacterium]